MSEHLKRHYGINVTRRPTGHGHVNVGKPVAELLARPNSLLSVQALITTAAKATSTATASRVDLRPRMPPVYDQGQLGSCTANALCAALQYVHPAMPMGSRLFLYYNERRMEGDIFDDAGAQLSDGVKCLETIGVCPESEWPYVVSKFTVAPTARCYIDATKNRASIASYAVPCDATIMKRVLMSGYPFVVGIAVFPSFETAAVAKTGAVPMPDANEQCIGGHAVLCVGYDDTRGTWTMRNSWGAGWGDHGYFYLPYAYLLDASLASDAWAVE